MLSTSAANKHFGVFWDMAADAAGPQALACQTRRAQSALPLQLHTFMDAAEVACPEGSTMPWRCG